MPDGPLRFEIIGGLRPSTRRAIGILDGEAQLNAKCAFEGLQGTDKRDLLARMEHWLSGNNKPKTWFHGWDGTYHNCFVFKVREHRFYGFLCHPKPDTAKGMQLCVLCFHAEKHQKETDKSILKQLLSMRAKDNVTREIRKTFPEYRGEE